jgi:hypothetical protein
VIGVAGLLPNKSTYLQTTLATETHLAEGQFLLEERTLNIENYRIYRAGTQRPTVSKRGQNIEPPR